MVNTIYQKSFNALTKRPFRLWGISLLGALLGYLAGIGFAGILAIGFAVSWALDVSLSMIFLKAYQTGEEPHTAALFQTFTKGRFLRVVGGMAWMALWIFLWGLIPVVGPVFACIRTYEYRFVPYILATRDEVKPTDALRVSKEETHGYKGQMFWADVIPVLFILAVTLVFSLLGAIPYLGVLFRLILALFTICYLLFLNLFYGIQHAAFYVEIQAMKAASDGFTPPQDTPAAPAAAQPQPTPQVLPLAPAESSAAHPQSDSPAPASRPKFCPICGAPIQLDEKFCTGCGHRL